MEACEYEHVAADDAVDQAVRESAKHRSAPVTVDYGESHRVLRQAGNEGLRGLKELVAQTGALALVPPLRVFKFRRCGRLKKDPAQCDLIRLRTSSHGMPPGLPSARSRSSSSDRASISRS